VSGLEAHLRRRIALEGPLTVADYMAEALAHPEHGYYMGRDPLGAAGDFVTAPEVSQMFGELLGLWCAVVWRAAGAPDPVRLVELGPGRGTLMADALRAARAAPDFLAAVRLHLVEASPALKARQEEALAALPLAEPPRWHVGFDQVPEGPLLLVANEFFDALPVRQFQRTPGGWSERLVDAGGPGGALRFVLAPPRPEPHPLVRLACPEAAEAPAGAVVEVSPAGLALTHAIGERLEADGVAALIVDYGYVRGFGDTLQAVRRHAFHDPLAEPGAADLTAHVNFAALARAAAEGGARPCGPVGQGEFLSRLGIAARAEALAAGAGPDGATEIAAALKRLIGPEEMGTLFKALALVPSARPAPPGFE
jgi:NADH dehydrogenase [ubiquinone] 1 alpha subcomplex assembly factor 7